MILTSDQDTITIYDATDKVGNTTNIISITTFPGAQYIHQGEPTPQKSLQCP